jgi:hypothetical protein
MNLEDRALDMALSTFLSSNHKIEDQQAIMEALNNSDETVLDELGVVIWEPFDEYPYAAIARWITDEEQMILSNLRIVRAGKVG